ncbi:MAG: FAD-dependent oxidoreductase [Candidatus Saccharibacteria bacterium]
MNIKLEFIGRNHVAADIWQLHFKKPRGFIFTAGQYLEVTVDDPNPDERGNQRWFTISASPTQADIIITTRLVEQHSEFKDDLFGLKPGDTLDAKGPMGDFVLPAKSANILWIAGGIGVTPFISQLQYLFDSKEYSRNIVLLHGVRSLNEEPAAGLIKQCEAVMPHLKVVQVLSESKPPNWQGHTGYITAPLIQKAVPDYIERQLFVSGPEPMVDSMKEILLKINVPEKNIHQDWFPGYKEKY